MIDKWEYKNLQCKTVPAIGLWSRVSRNDLETLENLQVYGWEVF